MAVVMMTVMVKAELQELLECLQWLGPPLD